MTNRQRLELEQSEKRQKINEFLGKETLSDTERTELDTLTKRMQTLEPELRAAIIAEPEKPATDPQFTELENRCSLGRVVDAIVNRTVVDGAENELQTEYRLESNQIPWSMLRPPETRAVTAAPSDVGANQQETLQPVFAGSTMDFLGIYSPTVPVGESIYPVLETRPTVGGPHTDSTEVAETDGTIVSVVLSPQRIQASFSHRRVDAARFADLDMTLRQALSSGLAEKMDYEVLRGTNGLLTGTNLSNNAVTAADTFATYASNYGYDRVDGRFASDISQVRSVVGTKTYSHMSAQYLGSGGNVDAFSALDKLMQRTGGVRVSAHIAVPDSTNNRQLGVVRLGSRRDMVLARWEGPRVVVDEFTQSKKGDISVTIFANIATKIVRAGGFHKQQSQVA